MIDLSGTLGALDKAWVLVDPLSRTYKKCLADARARAAAKNWQSTAEAYADLRALATSTGLTLRQLEPEARPDDEYSDRWGSALMLSQKLLAKQAGYNEQSADEVKTQASADPRAMAPIAILAIVLAALLYVAVVYFVIANVATIVDNQLKRNAADQELERLHAQAEKVASDHFDREQKAGHSIPWTPSELDYLNQLEKQIARLQGYLAPSVLPGSVLAGGAAGGATAAGGVFGGVLAVGALAGLGYLAWKGGLFGKGG